MNTLRNPIRFFPGLFAAALVALTARAEPLLRPNDRIVFVGDSITGLGAKQADGFVQQIAWAMRQAHPDATPTLIALGGSGQSVGSWLDVEERSRTAMTLLDVPNVEVKTTLDQGADVLVIMLGMNDLLAPYVSERKEDLDAWAERYRTLIRTLRERAKPRAVALATVTLLTEDPASPKNRVRNALNRRVAALATSERCALLSAGDEMYQMLQRGRDLIPDFHVTADFVHPNRFGHTAIALAVLKGLGENAMALRLYDRYAAALVPAVNLPALSYRLAADAKARTYTISYEWVPAPGADTTPDVHLFEPDNWSVAPTNAAKGKTGVFAVSGRADEPLSHFALRARAKGLERSMTVSIPAPWRVVAGVPDATAWTENEFTPTNELPAFESALIRGEGFDQPIACGGKTVPWTVYTASIDYTGGADPDSVDPASVAFGETFDAAYAARWIYSKTARPVDVVLGTKTFAGKFALTVWVNGESVYSKVLTKEPDKSARVPASLHEGWNRLLVKCDHLTWQWQFTCALAGRDGDDLRDLRYSATPIER